MLYDYFTKSAFTPKELAILSAPAAAAGALGSELTGGDWKDNLLNAAGAGAGTTAGTLGGIFGLAAADKAVQAVDKENLLPRNSKVLKLLRAATKLPALGIGVLAGLGGGLGYAATNAFAGKKERPMQDVLIDYLKGNG